MASTAMLNWLGEVEDRMLRGEHVTPAERIARVPRRKMVDAGTPPIGPGRAKRGSASKLHAIVRAETASKKKIELMAEGLRREHGSDPEFKAAVIRSVS